MDPILFVLIAGGILVACLFAYGQPVKNGGHDKSSSLEGFWSRKNGRDSSWGKMYDPSRHTRNWVSTKWDDDYRRKKR